ncbi:MAG: hypothetical protein JSW27_23895 [Phycisphaerales bacterium]|nr:MAG: hypothetical protein JSW27_23895 [Phycisphaerales bacterium]
MTEENTGNKKAKTRGSRKIIILSVVASLLLALACFIALALVPAPDGPPLKDPLRSLLTGLGVLGVAAPLCIAGFTLKKCFASSPYFEGKFIATVLNVFGFACFAAGLACIILGVYDWIVQFLESSQ